MEAETTSATVSQPLLKRMLRRFIPQRLLKERCTINRLGRDAGKAYLRLRVLDTLGIRWPNQRKVPGDARAFVFVCFGNIMRSPIAELMLKRALAEHAIDGVVVSSAGIHASPGREAHPRAQVAARELGLPLDNHFARLLTAEMVTQADAVFAMDFQNKAELLVQYPEARNKIFLLSAYAEGRHRYREIPDPYFGDQAEARRCYAVLNTCVQNLVRNMMPAANRVAAQRPVGIR